MDSNTFTQTVLTKLGANDLPEELQAEFMAEIGELVINASTVRSMETLDEQKQELLSSMIDDPKKTPEDVLDFLQEHVPNFLEIIEEETSRILAEWEKDATTTTHEAS